jgi:lipoprotein
MKFNLLTVTSLLCGLFLLGSCAKDEPQSGKVNTEAVDNGPRVNVPLQLDAEVSEFVDPQTAKSARTFNSPQSPVTVKDGANAELDDDLNVTATKQKVLSALRANFIAANPTIDVVLHVECGSLVENVTSTMSYDASLGRYRHSANVGLSQGMVTALAAANGTLTVYTGGTGYDKTKESFTVDPVMEEISLSSAASTPVNIPVLYASTGVQVKITNGTLLPVSKATSQLKPQGSLLLVTFRNNMNQDVTFDGITAVTNNYFGPNNESKPALLKLKGSKNSATELTTEATKYTSEYSTAVNGGKAYTYFYKDFASAGFTVAHGGARSDKAVIFWGYKGDALPVAPASANKFKDKDLLLDPGTGLIHIYAQNAKAGGQVIARPNYSVAPIGGANFAPVDGKAYTLNCEFYTQPRQALGYLDKGYLFKDGTWTHFGFNGNTNNPAIYNAITDVPLVSSAEAAEVLNGNVTTSKGKMFVMDKAWLNLTSLLNPIDFSVDATSSRFKDFSDAFAKGASGVDYRAHVYKELLPYKATNDDTSDFSSAEFVGADYAWKDQPHREGETGQAYRQLYIAPRNAATGAQPRSKYQTVMRYRTRSIKGGDGNIYVGALVMESIYLGKYFYGNVMTTPLLVTRGAARPFTYIQADGGFFENAEATRDLVTRVLLNAKTMNNISESLVLQPYATVVSHATNQGIQLLHWGAIDGEWEKAVMNLGNNRQAVVDYGNNDFNNVTRLSRVNRFYSYNGYNGGILALWRNTTLTPPDDKRGLFRNFTYQPLRAYSTKYQGNDGFDQSPVSSPQ